tara:strand:+ start:817 stop:1242 length:426 start_codon:yes stop_codon:yes gene_type:complete
MLSFFKKPMQKVSFQDIQYAIKVPNAFIMINTLSFSEQECLIQNTISCFEEETYINNLINEHNFYNKSIIIYGRNSNDDSIERKYNQITGHGFTQVFVYTGGLFEWLCLQDIYGDKEFPTTKKMLDILKYKPESKFFNKLM